MTLIIENVQKKFLPVFKGLTKSINAKYKIENTQAKLKTKRSDKEIAAEWKKEADEIIKKYKAGELKGFETAEEMAKAIENEI